MWAFVGVLLIVASLLAYSYAYVSNVLALIGAVVGIIIFIASIFGFDAEGDVSVTVNEDDRDD